jgi:hypothetical protein
MLILLSIAASTIPAELGPAWTEFSKAPSFTRHRTVVEVGTLGLDRESGQLVYWLRKQEFPLDGDVTVAWTDSKSCSAVKPVVLELSKVQPPAFAPPGVVDGQHAGADSLLKTIPGLDGTRYVLKGPSDFGGSIEIRSNTGTTLADWVEKSIAALQGCWTASVPKRAR